MKKYLLLFFFLSLFNFSYADDRIVYLDINLILNNSKAGKFLNSELKNINNKNIEELKKIELSIKSEDDKLSKQKNIIKEEDYKIKVVELRSKYKSYQELMKKKSINLNKIRENGANQILKVVNDILTEYSTKNNISFIVDKKNIIIGKTELDITNDILKLLDNKILKVNL
jgi:outer membrane protein